MYLDFTIRKMEDEEHFMNLMELKARAKINLSLDVLNKRADGYHEVKMIMQTLELHDNIIIEQIDKGIEDLL